MLCRAVLCCVALSELLLPGEPLKRRRLQRSSALSLDSLSAVLPPMTSIAAIASSASSSSASSLAALGSSQLRTARQRAVLRATESQQLAAVCAFAGYQRDPLAVMRQHLQAASHTYPQLSNKAEAAERRKERRKKASA